LTRSLVEPSVLVVELDLGHLEATAPLGLVLSGRCLRISHFEGKASVEATG
jgi:hypothetical protein